jgi:hypothetical protein
MFDQPKLNAKKARWMDLLSEFDFEIKHIKGKENWVVDALSRSIKMIHLATVSDRFQGKIQKCTKYRCVLLDRDLIPKTRTYSVKL